MSAPKGTQTYSNLQISSMGEQLLSSGQMVMLEIKYEDAMGKGRNKIPFWNCAGVCVTPEITEQS